MGTGRVTVIVGVCPQTQETDVRVVGMLTTLPADRPGKAARMRPALGPGPFR